MFCSNCGKQNEDNALFCANCGKSLAAPNSAPETQVLSENVPEPPYAEATAAQAAYTPAPETAYMPQTFPINETTPPSPKKMKKGLKLALICIPLVIILAVVVGIGSFAFSKLNSPLVKIGKGFSKLVTSGKSYNYNISFDDGYEEVNVSADVKIDLKGKSIDVANGQASSDGEDITFEGFLHTNDKEFGFLGKFEDEKIIMYNGYQMEYEDGELDYADYLFEDMIEALDIEDSEADEIFFSMISIAFDVINGDMTGEKAEQEIIKIIEKYSDSDIDFDKINLNIDEKIAKQVEKDLVKCLTDKKWLKENLGLTVSKKGKTTVYTFDLPIEKAVNALFDIVEPLLEDSYNKVVDSFKDAVGDDFDIGLPRFSYFANSVLDNFDDIDDDFSVSIDIEMTKNEISAVNVEIKEKYYGTSDTVNVRVEISKAKDFTAPKSDAYKKDLDEAKKLIEEYDIPYSDNYYDDDYYDYYGEDYDDDYGDYYSDDYGDDYNI